MPENPAWGGLCCVERSSELYRRSPRRAALISPCGRPPVLAQGQPEACPPARLETADSRGGCVTHSKALPRWWRPWTVD